MNSSDPLAELLERAADRPFTQPQSELDLLQRSAAQLLATSYDRQRLRDALQTLEERIPEAPAAPDDPVPMPGVTVLRALQALARALLAQEPLPVSPPPAETQRLATAVRDKKYAAEILRVLAADGDSRPVNVKQATGVKDDMTLFRVLSWAMSNGLVLRSAAETTVHYRLSALGETVLEALDEPRWVSLATTLVRLGVRQRMLSHDGDTWDLAGAQAPLVEEAAMLTGLSRAQTVRSLAEFARALEPAAVSNLAAALRYTPHAAHCEVVISPPVFPSTWWDPFDDKPAAPELTALQGSWALRLDSLAESQVVRGVERAGIPSRSLREVLPHHYLRASKHASRLTPPYHLPRDGRAIISIGSPEVNPMTTGLLFDYGVSVHLRRPRRLARRIPGLRPQPGPAVVWREGTNVVEYAPSGEHDYGLLLRIYDDHTGFTHFVLGGLLASGTYAACRYFHRDIEERLEEFPQQSFASLLRVPRSYGRRKMYTCIRSEPVGTSVNLHAPLDMRYVEVLPLLSEMLLNDGERVRGHLAETLEGPVPPEVDPDEVRALAAEGFDEQAPICRRVRDTAGAYSLLGRFEELVELVVHGVVARRTGSALREEGWSAGDLAGTAGLSKFAAAAVSRILARRAALANGYGVAASRAPVPA